MEWKIEEIKPGVGAVVRVDRAALFEPGAAERCLKLLEDRGALVFPQIGLTDEEQLRFTDALGARVNFTHSAPGGDVDTRDVYTITLDKNVNQEPEYVYGSWFWHLDGACMDIPMPKVTAFSCRWSWREGDFAMWNNRGVLHRALPYAEDCGRRMNRTSVSGLAEAA